MLESALRGMPAGVREVEGGRRCAHQKMPLLLVLGVLYLQADAETNENHYRSWVKARLSPRSSKVDKGVHFYCLLPSPAVSPRPKSSSILTQQTRCFHRQGRGLL